MSWHQHTTALAMRLRGLITSPITLRDADVPAFTQARAAVWALVRDTYGPIVAAARQADAETVEQAAAMDLIVDLDQQRVAVLGHAAPATPPQVPADPANLSATGTMWRAVERDARLARAVWETSPPSDRPSGRELVPLYADVVSLAWAMSQATINAASRWLAAQSAAFPPRVLDHAETTRVSTAATLAVLQRAGSVTTYADLFPAVTRAVTVDSLDQLPGGIRAVADFLERRPHMSPAMVAFIALQHRGTTIRIATVLGRVASAVGEPALRAVGAWLSRHARHLDVAVPRVLDATTVNPIDDTAWTAYTQARLAYLAADALLRDAPPTKETAVTLLHAAAQVPRVSTNLSDLADRHVATGAWLVRTDRPTDGRRPPWVPTTIATQLDLSTQLRHALVDANDLSTQLPRPDRPSARRVIRPLVRNRQLIHGPAGWTVQV